VSELDEIRSALWNDPEKYSDSPYQRDLFEQYRLCLQMADKVSERRGLTNNIFLTFNSAGAAALAVSYQSIGDVQAVVILAIGMVLCFAWGFLLRSYRSLNTAKFKVIGVMEERLPASPFWAAEWNALGQGKDWRKHLPLSPLETIVPIGFGVAYALLAIVTIVSAT